MKWKRKKNKEPREKVLFRKWKKMCAGKAQHATENSALYVLGQTRTKVPQNVYKCDFCGKWHIGKSKDESKKKRK